MDLKFKLDQVVSRHDELQRMLSDGQLESGRFAQVSKEYAEITPLVEAILELRKVEQERADLELMADDAIRAQIHSRASEADIRAAALKAGMVLMRDDGERLVQAGVTSREELVRVTRD